MNSALILKLSHSLWRNGSHCLRSQLLSRTIQNCEIPARTSREFSQQSFISSFSCYERRQGNGKGGSDRQSSQGSSAKLNRLGAGGAALALSIPFFGKKGDDEYETPEDKLIMAIKRSILCIQRSQYDKAEQMLHLALRMAQDIQSKEGVLHIFDIMANLAMEREQYKKAEKLFVDVMQRLFADGHTEDSPQFLEKMLHISSKMAHMAHMQGDLEKAVTGFKWTLSKIEGVLNKMPEDLDMKELLGLTKNWFGQLLIKQGKYQEARMYLQEAYDCLVEVYGRINEQAITILNNLSVACVNLENFSEAKKYIIQALDLAIELKDIAQEGVLQANLGLILLQEGLVQQAKEACTQAYRKGKQNNIPEAVEQASYCLDEIKNFIQNK